MSFGGISTQKITIDRQTVLVAVAGIKQWVLSESPSMTTAIWNSPSIVNIIETQLNLSNDGNIQLMGNLAFPFEKGQELYVSIISAGRVQLYFEDSLI